MRPKPLVLSCAMVLPLLSLGPLPARAQKPTPEQQIILDSDWDMEIHSVGPTQRAGIRIRGGAILPGDTRLTNVVGTAAFTAPGQLSLSFLNHPKIAPGEATVVKVQNGVWAGPLVQPGLERRLVLKRRR
ncbi:MAG: hypothetical protein U0835_24995 [Isosphaeraceae bacterium]